MMKKVKLSIFMALFTICGLLSSNVNAFPFFIPEMLPPFPSWGPIEDVPQVAQYTQTVGVWSNVTNVKSTLNGISDIKGTGLVYSKGPCFVNCSAGLDQSKPVSAAKEIETSSTFDIYDPESVRKAFYQNFSVLPTEGLSDENCYRNQGRKFYKDTIVEIYAAASVVESNIATMEKTIADLSVGLEEGSKTSELDADEPDNTNTAWENAYKVYDSYDQLLRMTQQLKAMKIQYEAALAIQSKAPPIRKKEIERVNSGQTSFIFNETKKFASSTTMAFAQVSSTKTEDNDYNFLGYVDAPKPTAKMPFEGQEDNLQALSDISELGSQIYQALDIHNLVTTLPEYRDIFLSYERVARIHEHSVGLLRSSDQCAINYLGYYYNDPEKIWSGGSLGTMVNQHDMRKGISRWLIDTFDVAKAQLTNVAEPEEMMVDIIDSKTDNTNVKSIDSLKNSGSDKENISNPVKDKKESDLARVSYLLPWNLSAEISRDLGKDQQGSSQWGSLKKQYPLWKDQINYYDEYMNGKFDNIVKYLELIDLRPSEIDIARKFNQLNSDEIISNHDAIGMQNNSKWLDDLFRFEALTPIEEVTVPKSEWLDLVNQQIEEVEKSHVQLSDSEKAKLEKRVEYVADREKLVNERNALYTKIDTLLAEYTNIRTGSLRKEEIKKEITNTRNQISGYTSKIVKVDANIASIDSSVSGVKIQDLPSWQEYLSKYSDGSVSEETSVPESKWLDPIHQKRSAMVSNQVELNEREATLRARRAELLTRRAELVTQKARLNSEIASLEAEYNRASVSNARKVTIRNQIMQKRDEIVVIDREITAIDNEIVAIDAELTDIEKNRKWLQAYDYDLLGVVRTEEWTVDTNNEYLLAKEKEAAEILKLETEFKDSIAVFENTITNIVKQRDQEIKSYEDRLEVLSTQIDEALDKMKTYNKAINNAEEGDIEVNHKMTNKNTSTVNRANLKNLSAEQKALAKRLSAEATALINKIDERKKYYDARIANAERELSIKNRDMYENIPDYEDMIPLSYLYNNKIVRAITGNDRVYIPALTQYLKDAFNIAEEFRPYTLELAEKTREDIFKLNMDLYLQSSNELVNGRYKEFIEKLKNVPLEEVLSFSTILRGTYSSPVVMMEFVKSLYRKYMMEQICPNDACLANDEQYFVGIFAKDKDFQAPKEPINEYLPPLREVFFFDEVDFAAFYNTANRVRVDNLNNRYYVSKYGIINYGGKVPAVWQLALSGKAFVERDIDLETFFGDKKRVKREGLFTYEVQDNTINKVNFFRGGRYPCKIDGRIVDIDKNANFVITQGASDSIPVCQEIELRVGGGYATVVSKSSGDSSHIGYAGDPGKNYNSELGQMFAYSTDYLVFRESLEDAFKRLAELKQYQEEEKEYSTNIRDVIYDGAVLKMNQFGNFIDYVELERAYRQAREKIKLGVDDAKKVLFEELRKAGYNPSENLNLANDNDYNTVRKSLISKKSKILNEVAPKIRALRTNTNELVVERLKNFEDVYKALEMDSEVLVAAPSSNVNLSEFSEEIKTERANQKAKEEYAKETDSAFNEEMNKISAPYCASY